MLEPVRRAGPHAGFELLDEALGALPARCAACAADEQRASAGRRPWRSRDWPASIVAYGQRVALEDVSLEAAAGRVVGLIGPNGAGKTTLLRALLGMLAPAQRHVEAPGPIGYMPQLAPAAWDFPLTALDVALQGGYRRTGWLRRPSRAEQRRAAREALDAVGLGDFGRPPDRPALRRPAPARAAGPHARAGRRRWCCSTSR